MDKIVKIIKENKGFLITVHDNLDGDSLGSGLALGLALKKLEKDIKFLLKTPIPEQYRFLPGIKKLAANKVNIKKYNVLFILDTAGWNQMEKLNPGLFKKYTIINIDHHVDNTRFGSLNWINPKASAVGESVYNLLKRLRITITKDIAACLYTAILTDTGCFQFTNTTPVTHRIAASLLKTGISPSIISNQIYERMPPSRLKLLQYALSTLKLGYHNRIIWMWITREMLKRSGANKEDIEGFIEYLRATSGIQIAILFKETAEKNRIRVTFRSKGPRIHVNKIAHEFGGGGHPAAAGCTINGTRREVEKRVLKAVVKTIKSK